MSRPTCLVIAAVVVLCASLPAAARSLMSPNQFDAADEVVGSDGPQLRGADLFTYAGDDEDAFVTDCGFSAKGKTIDLSSLESNEDYNASDPTHAYKLNVCQVIKSGILCKLNKAMICQYNTSTSTPTATIAKWDPTASKPAWAFINSDNVGDGVSLTLANGDQCTEGTAKIPRVAVVEFVCDKAADPVGEITVQSLQNPQSCKYTFRVPTNLVCFNGPASSKLSNGWIFSIVILTVLPLYVIIGCIYNNQRNGRSGMDMCPNSEFWRGLPSLVKDGCVFTFGGLRSCCRKDGDSTSYDQVE